MTTLLALGFGDSQALGVIISEAGYIAAANIISHRWSRALPAYIHFYIDIVDWAVVHLLTTMPKGLSARQRREPIDGVVIEHMSKDQGIVSTDQFNW